MSVKRKVCATCNYPQKTCVCFAVSTIEIGTRVSVLQHPNESGHAKNTARLLALLSPQIHIHVGDKSVHFSALEAQLPAETLVVYPAPDAQSLASLAKTSKRYTHIVLLDGSWRQAKKIWLSNPWLGKFDSAVIDTDIVSSYSIRKAPDANSLSTLEAAALTLNQLDDVPLRPFLNLLDALTNNWKRFSPQ